MDLFENYYTDLKDTLFDIIEENPDLVSKTELSAFRGYINACSIDYCLDIFIKKGFTDLENLKNKSSPKAILEMIGDSRVEKIYERASEPQKNDFWDSVHGLVKSAILHIHQKREHDGTKYTREYFKGYSVKKLSEEWCVKI